MKITAVVLTFNEERHIGRCIDNLRQAVDEIVIVDSLSTDATLEIARSHGARIVQHEWVNHAAQFNWALTQLGKNVEWVLRVDADEYLTSQLASEIKERVPILGPDVAGVYLRRRMTFQGKLIRHGGVFPIRVLRLFRLGRGQCERRWMDEHITVFGQTVDFEGELIDDNLHPLTRWIEKHNQYSSREAIEMLNLEYRFMQNDAVAQLRGGKQHQVKRWLKEFVYAKMPPGLRALTYFFYRYVVRFGFLDGTEGASFHVLQGFWYRYLVDAKIAEVKRCMASEKTGVVEAIEMVLGLRIPGSEGASLADHGPPAKRRFTATSDTSRP